MERYRKEKRNSWRKKAERRSGEQMDWNDEVMYRVMMGLAAAVILAAAVLFFVPDLRNRFQAMPCALRAMTGLYCPGCGGTRAFLFFLHGQLGKSLYYNPAVSCVLIFCLVYMASHTLKHLTGGKIRGIHYRNLYCYLGLALLVANWVWKNYMLLAEHKMLIP